MKISVCIITKNRQLLLRRCLESVRNQITKNDQIVIIDSSTSSIRTVAKKYFPTLYYRYEPQATIPQARQLAISTATHKVIMFVDDDCVLLPSTTYKIRKYFSDSKGPDLVMGQLLNIDPKNVYSSVQHYFFEIWMEENFSNRETVSKFIDGKPLHFDLLAVKKKFIERTNFDIKAPRIFNDDDIDIGVQLFRSKGSMIYDPTIKTYYQPRANFLPLMVRSFHNGFSDHYMLLKHSISTQDVPYPLSLQRKCERLAESLRGIPQGVDRWFYLLVVILYLMSFRSGWFYLYLWSIKHAKVYL